MPTLGTSGPPSTTTGYLADSARSTTWFQMPIVRLEAGWVPIRNLPFHAGTEAMPTTYKGIPGECEIIEFVAAHRQVNLSLGVSRLRPRLQHRIRPAVHLVGQFVMRLLFSMLVRPGREGGRRNVV
jgi:hypothetical protein